MTRLVFVDAGVLIAAARGRDEAALRAMEVLDDPDAQFASSVFLKLEVLPKALYQQKHGEVAFYEAFFDEVSIWADPDEQLLREAYSEAVTAGLSAMDALHVTAASTVDADEFVTTEKATRPIHRTRLLQVRTITRDRAE